MSVGASTEDDIRRLEIEGWGQTTDGVSTHRPGIRIPTTNHTGGYTDDFWELLPQRPWLHPAAALHLNSRV